MAKIEKYSKKSLANQMFCLPLPLPTGRECTTTKDILVSCSNSFGRSLVALLHSCSRDLLANKRGCALSFCTYINRIFDLQCQQVSRIRSRCKVRPQQTSRPRNGRISTNSQRASSSNSYRAISRTRSRPKNSTAQRPRSSLAGATTSYPAAMPPCTMCRPSSTPCRTSTVNIN